MLDLTTTYLGLELRNPLVASSSPLSKRVDTVRQMEEAGIAAVVMYSLFEEQILQESRALDHYLNRGTETYAESLTYLPDIGTYSIGPDVYLNHLQTLKRAVDIPIIGSLNGVSAGGWTEYARLIEEAGADALELNTYYLPIDPNLASADLEDAYVALVREVCSRVSIPVAVKISPFFTALPNFVRRLVDAGASGLVLFNRFYQPDIDLETLDIVPNLNLSTSSELRLPLRWIALLSGRVPADFAATSGVHTAEDVLKVMMVGAKTAMMASGLLRHGIVRVSEILRDINAWMDENEYESIRQMQGSMRQDAVGEPAALERANYMKMLSAFDTSLHFTSLHERDWQRPNLASSERDSFWSA